MKMILLFIQKARKTFFFHLLYFKALLRAKQYIYHIMQVNKLSKSKYFLQNHKNTEKFIYLYKENYI